jgi:hypothetical protein
MRPQDIEESTKNAEAWGVLPLNWMNKVSLVPQLISSRFNTKQCN